ncbi:hypothetical protein GPX89_35425 [Nocardia sp. ET3-3]|uniref:Uncharacterized protein n=1 Tax=Nocardia terrae TaxID=2675851 RepID=A0A7K1V7S9_9NOCA|nr:hypothetical protein [Nocardia terrae]MVU82509.1 hypothetical protein [Nocardia terrae]
MPSSLPSLRAGRSATVALLAVTAAGTLTATTLAYLDAHGSGSSGGATQSTDQGSTVTSDGTAANAVTPVPTLSPGSGRSHARSSGS